MYRSETPKVRLRRFNFVPFSNRSEISFRIPWGLGWSWNSEEVPPSRRILSGNGGLPPKTGHKWLRIQMPHRLKLVCREPNGHFCTKRQPLKKILKFFYPWILASCYHHFDFSAQKVDASRASKSKFICLGQILGQIKKGFSLCLLKPLLFLLPLLLKVATCQFPRRSIYPVNYWCLINFLHRVTG